MSAPRDLQLQELCKLFVRSSNDRLDGKLTRDAHAQVVATVGAQLRDLGADWADLYEVQGQLQAQGVEL